MSFQRTIKKFTKETNKRIERVCVESFLSVVRSVVHRSPVDTSRFRANWFSSLNNPLVGFEYETYDLPGQLSINRSIRATRNFRIGNEMWVTNHIPYAERLEYGYSAQAPMGMVRLADGEWINTVRTVASAIL